MTPATDSFRSLRCLGDLHHSINSMWLNSFTSFFCLDNSIQCIDSISLYFVTYYFTTLTRQQTDLVPIHQPKPCFCSSTLFWTGHTDKETRVFLWWSAKGEEPQANHGKLQTLHAKSSLPHVILLFSYNFSLVANSQELAVYAHHPRATARIEDSFHPSPLRQVCKLKQTKL